MTCAALKTDHLNPFTQCDIMFVPARAIVDKLNLGVNLWRVEVWGDEPFDFIRIYTIQALTDTLAANEGLRLFTEEMQNGGAEDTASEKE